MSTLDTARDDLVARFERGQAELASRGPAWLGDLRRGAIDRFAQLGFPTRKIEAWKYTNTAPIAAGGFDPLADSDATLDRDALGELFGASADTASLVFVDGRFAPELSSGDLPDGVRVESLAARLSRDPDGLRDALEAGHGGDDRPFVALNLAFARDGAVVTVSAGTISDSPIELRFVATRRAEGAALSPCNLVVVERGARAVLAIRYASLCDAPHLTNAVTRVRVEANAELDLVTEQSEDDRAFHVSAVDVSQARDSRFRSHVLALGSAISRSEIHADLAEPGVECTLNGLFIGDGAQHLANRTRIDHASPHGTSRELYKGILDGRSRGVFDGLVHVHPDAQKTDAQQSNPNLLASDEARVNAKPNLEIHADDVKCSHGSTIGRLDEDALFYLRSRGIAEDDAREMLTGAFASQITREIPGERLRDALERRVTAKLARASTNREAA